MTLENGYLLLVTNFQLIIDVARAGHVLGDVSNLLLLLFGGNWSPQRYFSVPGNDLDVLGLDRHLGIDHPLSDVRGGRDVGLILLLVSRRQSRAIAVPSVDARVRSIARLPWPGSRAARTATPAGTLSCRRKATRYPHSQLPTRRTLRAKDISFVVLLNEVIPVNQCRKTVATGMPCRAIYRFFVKRMTRAE